MLRLYRFLAELSAPLLTWLLARRLRAGKEHANRMPERMGRPSRPRPDRRLVWLHAASVGEAQSALILLHAVLQRLPQTHILVTTGTPTSAALMEKRLPAQATHQFYPLDHPDWCARFLDHWRPDLVLWMESELWPNMLLQLKSRGIPAALVNARLSGRSFSRWRLLKGTARTVLSAFSIVLAQTPADEERFRALGAKTVVMTDNLKYSAAPLPADADALTALRLSAGERPCWLYASTHAGEEDLACTVHKALKDTLPDVLTVIAPRHPDRRADVVRTCAAHGLSCVLRSEGALPRPETDIYIADTLGELGLFYRFAPVAVVGRSFSDDGGGGHNPVEAAQLGCAVMSGPLVQYQADLFAAMTDAKAVTMVKDKARLAPALLTLLNNPADLKIMQECAQAFADSKSAVITRVTDALAPLLEAYR